MMFEVAEKNSKDGIHRFLKPFPWWYSLVKWLVPMAVGAISALLIGGIITGIIGVPTFLSELGVLPVLYKNISSFGAFSLLSILMMTTGTMIGGAAGLLTWVGLFPLVQTIASDNFKAVDIVQTLTKDMHKEQIINLTRDFEKVLLELDAKNEILEQKLQQKSAEQQAVDPLLLSKDILPPVGGEPTASNDTGYGKGTVELPKPGQRVLRPRKSAKK